MFSNEMKFRNLKRKQCMVLLKTNIYQKQLKATWRLDICSETTSQDSAVVFPAGSSVALHVR
jgi:hypothetical protein